MALDFEKLKDKFSKDNIKTAFAKGSTTSKKGESGKKQWLNHPVVVEVKKGLEDIQVAAHEGKFHLFVKQIVVLLVLFLVVRFITGKLAESKAKIKDKVAAIQIQQANKEDYLENKQQLLRLEPLFPDISQKGDWMLRRLINIFETHNITPNIDGNVSETAEKTYTKLVQPVTFQQSFAEIGKLIADIENGDDFLRISEISIVKQTSPETLGENTATVTFNTVFPKEKYAPKLFKDYAQQMKKIQAAQGKPAQAEAATEGGK